MRSCRKPPRSRRVPVAHPFVSDQIEVNQPVLELNKHEGLCEVNENGKPAVTLFVKRKFNGSTTLVEYIFSLLFLQITRLSSLLLDVVTSSKNWPHAPDTRAPKMAWYIIMSVLRMAL